MTTTTLSPTATASSELATLQQAVVGRYAIEREIGRGGMGLVYLARDLALERPVAIKLLPPEHAMQPVLRERFLREARTAAALSHPNIVPIHAVEEHGSLVFFAMGYVEGETLARRIVRAGSLPPGDVSRMVQEVAWALSYAHGRGIVHRDVKPDNILLEVGSGRAMVTDFGIARRSSSAGLTELGHVVGTPQYMSPEQAAGEELDGRSDVYSLGVVAYQALTGRLPFEATSAQALLSKHLTETPPPVASVRPGVPRALADAIDRCLAKAPEARFASGEELARALGVQPSSGEIAPQVRHFMRYAEQMTTLTFVFVIIIVEMSIILSKTARDSGLIVGMAVGITIPWIDLLVRARRVLRHGFTYDDVRAGFLLDLENRRRETELSAIVTPAQARRRLTRSLTALAIGVWMAAGSFIWKPNTDLGSPSRAIARWLGVAGVLVAGVGYVFAMLGNPRLERRGAVLYGRIWTRGFARHFFRLAGARLKRAPAATTRSVAEALEDAIARRPAAERRRARGLVREVRALEERVGALRVRERELDTLVAEAGPDRVGTGDVAAASAFDARRATLTADLREARARAGESREALVSALEAIRLQLLRVRAGLASTEELTGDIAAARAVADRDAGTASAGGR